MKGSYFIGLNLCVSGRICTSIVLDLTMCLVIFNFWKNFVWHVNLPSSKFIIYCKTPESFRHEKFS